MVSPLLSINYKTDTQPQIRIIQDNLILTQGNPFGALETGTSTSQVEPQRVVQFSGVRSLYAFIGSSVYYSPDGGVNWSVVYTAASFLAGANFHGGPYIININGIPNLCIYYQVTGGTYVLARSANGTTWTVGTASGTTSTLVIWNSIIFQDKLYLTGPGNFYAVLDFTSLTFTYVLMLITYSNYPAEFVIHDGVLYLFTWNNSSVLFRLLRINGASYSPAVSWTSTGGPTTVGDIAIWSYNGNMYCLARRGDVASQFLAYRISSSLVVTTITSSIPATIISGWSSASVIKSVVDSESDISGSNIYVYIRNSSNGYDVYQASSTSFLVFQFSNTAANTNWAIPFTKNSQGNTFYEFGKDHAEITSISNTDAGILVSYRIWGANNYTGPASFQLFYGTMSDTYVSNPASLASPNIGTVSGNTVSGITADNGGTLYTVVWDLGSNGFDSGDLFRLTGQLVINYPRRRRRRRKRWYRL